MLERKSKSKTNNGRNCDGIGVKWMVPRRRRREEEKRRKDSL
jgi:hypothetical protein